MFQLSLISAGDSTKSTHKKTEKAQSIPGMALGGAMSKSPGLTYPRPRGSAAQ